MAYIIGMLTASLSFLANRVLLKYIGPEVIISYSPILEEAAKTLLSYLLGADILATHFTFGILEALYDWHISPKYKLWAALSSMSGHGLFGLITMGILFMTGSIWMGLMGGIVTHLCWNAAVVYYQVKQNQE